MKDIPIIEQTPNGKPFGVYRADEFSQLVSQTNQAHRLKFHSFVLISKGSFQHFHEWENQKLTVGTLVLVQPNQVHYFNYSPDWAGWVVTFQPEFLPENDPILAEFRQFSGYFQLSPSQYESLARQLDDLHASFALPETTLRQQLQQHLLIATLARILIFNQSTQPPQSQTGLQQRFQQFERLLEQQFRQNRNVADYARQLTCTEKTLRQTCLMATGQSSKTLIAQRLVLEAKRLLLHSTYSISQIAYYLGFDETTNFSKFFRLNVGMSAGEFRKISND